MSYDPRQVAFVDTETTGLDPEQDRIWEIAVIVDGEEHVWQQRWSIHPDDWRMVSPWVLENTGIRDRFDFYLALDPHESIERLVKLIRGRHVIGACPWFDSDRLHRVDLATTAPGGDRDLKWHYHLVDVENLAVGWLAGRFYEANDWPPPMEFPWSSESLSLLLGVDPADYEPRHTALADARWAKAMFEVIAGDPCPKTTEPTTTTGS